MRSKGIAAINFTDQTGKCSGNFISKEIFGAGIKHTILAAAGEDAAQQAHCFKNALDVDIVDAISKSDHGSEGAMFFHSGEMIVGMGWSAL